MRSRSVGAGSATTLQHARIESLGDPLDGAALAGGVAALEQHDHLELPVDHPVLQLDELVLQPQQLLEIFPAVHAVRGFPAVFEQGVEPVIVDFELELLVDAVDELIMDPVAKLGLAGVDAHLVPIGERPGTCAPKPVISPMLVNIRDGHATPPVRLPAHEPLSRAGEGWGAARKNEGRAVFRGTTPYKAEKCERVAARNSLSSPRGRVRGRATQPWAQ